MAPARRTPPAPPLAPVLAPALAPAPGAALALPGDPDASLSPEQAAALGELARKAWAPETRRAYARAWRSFEGWCHNEGRRPLPATVETLAVYVGYLVSKGVSIALLNQRLGGIAQAHVVAGVDPPPTASKRIHLLVQGARRELFKAPTSKDPLLLDALRRCLPDGDDLGAVRDRAILLLGFFGGFRRTEVASLDVGYLQERPDGLVVRLPRSKTDQEGEGQTVGVARREDELCPVQAVRRWLDEAQIVEGPVFRGLTSQRRPRAGSITGGTIGAIVKKHVEAAGVDPARFGGHSLRAGLVTQSILDDVPIVKIMATTRHKSATTLARYYREADPIKRGASGLLGKPKLPAGD